MTTETTNIGQNRAGSDGQAAAEALGSSNWEERLAAAREKRLQVLEQRRKSGDFVPDAPAIVGPKPWEVDGQADASELSFVEEFEPDDFDYEDAEPPEDLETSVLPLSAAVAAAERDNPKTAEEEEDLDEEVAGHWRAVTFIGVGTLVGFAVAFGASTFVRKNELPPDFMAGGSAISGNIREAAVVVDTTTPALPVQPELAGASAPASPTIQPTIESLASDISDDIVAVAVETTRAVDETAALTLSTPITYGQISRPKLVTGNSDTPLLMSAPSNVSSGDVLASLPSLDLPEPLAFESTLRTDGAVTLAALSSMSSPVERYTSQTFDPSTAIITQVLPNAPSMTPPVESPDPLMSPWALSDAATSWSEQATISPGTMLATVPAISVTPDVQPDLQAQTPEMTPPTQNQPASLFAYAASVLVRPDAQAIGATQTARADETLPEAQPAPAQPEALLLAYGISVPVQPDFTVSLPSTDPVAKSPAQSLTTPQIALTEPLAAVPSPDTRRVIGGDLSRYLVRMHVPSAVPEDGFAERADALRASGLALSTARVNFKISQDQIRFFHPDDAVIANAIAEEIGGTVRDFTDFSPQPPNGTVEIWLSGNSAKPAQPARVNRVTKKRTTTTRKRRVDPATALRNQLARRLRRGDHL